MKELKILKELEYESIAGMGDDNNHIKALVIELLCENHNYDLEGFKQCYKHYITDPLKNYKWRGEKEWYKDRFNIVDLGFYRIAEEIKF